MTGGALLVAGTTSDAGKSMVVAGLCRLLARKGIRVAPFKAQNMSNNSAVTVEGGEIGRAQAMQARAAGLAPSVRFNPVLLKPGSDHTSQLVVRGSVAGTVRAAGYMAHRDRLAALVANELASLRTAFDAVICEGAGSPAEINLRATDLANMGLARAAGLPVVVVGDIDRGGLLAHLFGTAFVRFRYGDGFSHARAFGMQLALATVPSNCMAARCRKIVRRWKPCRVRIADRFCGRTGRSATRTLRSLKDG